MIYSTCCRSLRCASLLFGFAVGLIFVSAAVAQEPSDKNGPPAEERPDGSEIADIEPVERLEGIKRNPTDPRSEFRPFYSLAVSSDGKFLAAHVSRAALIWNLPERKFFGGFRAGGLFKGTEVHFVPNSPFLVATLDMQRALAVWDMDTGKIAREIPIGNEDDPERPIPGFIAASPDGSMVAVSAAIPSEKFGIWVFDTSDFSIRWSKEMAPDPEKSKIDLQFLVFSPDSKRLYSSRTGVTAWNSETGGIIYQRRPEDYFVDVDVSPDGRYLATITASEVSKQADFGLAFWGAEKGRLIRKMSSQQGPIYTASFAGSSKYVVTGGVNPSLHIWNVETGESRPLANAGGYIRDLEIVREKDEDLLLSCGKDGIIRFWKLSELIDAAP